VNYAVKLEKPKKKKRCLCFERNWRHRKCRKGKGALEEGWRENTKIFVECPSDGTQKTGLTSQSRQVCGKLTRVPHFAKYFLLVECIFPYFLSITCFTVCRLENTWHLLIVVEYCFVLGKEKEHMKRLSLKEIRILATSTVLPMANIVRIIFTLLFMMKVDMLQMYL
jgi:hypothetical protein